MSDGPTLDRIELDLAISHDGHTLKTDTATECLPDERRQPPISRHSNESEVHDIQEPSCLTLSKKLTTCLYISHFISTWNSRLFEMGAVLFIAAVFPGTLLPVSIYALARNGIAVILSTAIGTIIDTRNRLSVVQWSILGQRIAVAASCSIFLVIYILTGLSSVLRSGLFVISIIAACIEKLCSIMNIISIERDWVVAITEDRPGARLTMNARMRRIDLFCKVVGPLTISLVDGASTVVGIWLTLGFSCVCVCIEYFAITKVYRLAPALHKRPVEETLPTMHIPRCQNTMRQTLAQVFPVKSFLFYVHHPAFLPSFSLALLYLTVLSFSGQMIIFLLSSNYSSVHVGIARTVSTVFELSATWVATRLQNCIGSVRGGIWSVNWQTLFLTCGLVWFVIHGQNQGFQTVATASGLVGGVILSRVGLWSFDLCVQTIIQEEVQENQRGAFSTVEASLQNLFELLSYITTIIFARPDQFLWPSVISTVAVYAAGALYVLFVRRRRGHLLHQPLCLKT